MTIEEILKKRWLEKQSEGNVSNVKVNILFSEYNNLSTKYHFEIYYSIETEFVIEHKKDVCLTECIEHEICFKKEAF
jgi:hypothetical protein